MRNRSIFGIACGLVLLAVSTLAIVAGQSAYAATSTYRAEVMSDAPRGFWRLGETTGTVAADQVGADPGVYRNGVTLGLPGAILGDPDKAAHFDGIDDEVGMGDPASGALDLGTGDFTVEAWVKTTVNREQIIASKQTSGPYWQVTVTDDYGATGRVRARLYDGSVTAQAYGPAVHVDDGAWHHVVVLFDRGTGITIYVDKTYSRLTLGSMSRSVSNSAPFVIGGQTVYSYPSFRGQIDDVALYPRLLTTSRIQAHYDSVTSMDTTTPSVTMSVPSQWASIADTTPEFSGTASMVVGDSSTVSVKIYSGTSTVGTPVGTATTVRDVKRAWSAEAQQLLPLGTYTAQAQQSDAAGHTGFSTAVTFTVTQPGESATDPTLLAAGDIADCNSTGDEATAALLDAQLGAVATLGDNVYESGTDSEFANCYQPTWGRHRARTYPTVGDHEYQTAGAAGYFRYFGAVAGDPSKGYYSYDLGAWHVVVLNSNCGEVGGCQAGSAQEQWLRADLALHPAACTLATVGSPLFSSGSKVGNNLEMKAFWQALYDYHADVVLTGDDHDYERFAPQTPSATLSLSAGVSEFVVGTGGRSHYAFPIGVPAANSQVRNDDSFGILKLKLHPAAYDWQFIPVAGKTFTDYGSRTCH